MSTRSTLLVFRSFPTFFRSSGCRFSRSSIVMTAFPVWKVLPHEPLPQAVFHRNISYRDKIPLFLRWHLLYARLPLAVFWNKWRKYNAFILFLFPFFATPPRNGRRFSLFIVFWLLVIDYWLLLILFLFPPQKVM